LRNDDLKFGLRLPTFALGKETADLDQMAEYLRQAEKMGFAHAFVIDHLLTTPPAYACTWLDALTTLTALAARTSKIKLGPLVLVLPLRHPVSLAKTLATMDFLSDGRIILGLGVGWGAEEFQTLNVPTKNRGKRTEESIEILKALWTSDHVNYHGDFYNVNDLTIDPKPKQRPHIPFWIGGGMQPFEVVYGMKSPDVTPVLRRIAKYAQAWIPHSSSSPEMNRKDWEGILGFCKEFGRDPEEIEIVYSNFVYLRKTGDELSKVRSFFAKYSGLSFEHIQQNYLVGTPDEVARKIKTRLNATDGMDHVVLNPINWELDQLEAIRNEVIPQLMA